MVCGLFGWVAGWGIIREGMAAVTVYFSEGFMHEQAEGKEWLAIPLENFPRLARGTPEQRDHWQLAGAGQGIHWPELDDDINVPALYGGRSEDGPYKNGWPYL